MSIEENSKFDTSSSLTTPRTSKLKVNQCDKIGKDSESIGKM